MSETEKPKTPAWAMEPFKTFLNQSERLRDLLMITVRGISTLRGMPRVVEVIADIEDSEKSEPNERLKYVQRLAELAEREVESNFPLVHGQALVSLWTSLEVLIRDFLAEWIRRVPAALEIKQISRVRIPLADYQQLSDDERYYFLVDQLDRDVSGPLKRGVNRFEVLLEPFSLSGPVDSDVRRDLYELSEIRNALVHRGGIADIRLVKACPWLELSAGDPIEVSFDQYQQYYVAIHAYVVTLVGRIGDHFGVNMDGVGPDKSADC